MNHVDSQGRPSTLAQLLAGMGLVGILYNLSPSVAPSLTSARLGLVLLTVATFGRWTEVGRILLSRFRWFTIIQIFVIAYNVVVWAFSNYADYQQISRNVHFFILCYVGAVMTGVALRGNVTVFNRIVTFSLSIYAVLTFLAFLSSQWLAFGVRTFVRVTNFTESAAGRVSAFGYGGADTSVLQFVGIVSSLLLLVEVKHNAMKLLFAFSAVLCGAATILMGRTGFVAGLMFVAAVMVGLLQQKRFIAFGSIAAIVLAAAFIWKPMWDSASDRNEDAHYMRNWVERVFSKEAVYETNLEQFAEIPRISMKTIFGTGLIGSAAGYNASGHDSGYIQTYFASGLLCAAVFYISYFAFLLGGAAQGRQRLLMVTVIGLMALMEVKEPFIFKYSISYYVTTLVIIRSFASTSRTRIRTWRR